MGLYRLVFLVSLLTIAPFCASYGQDSTQLAQPVPDLVPLSIPDTPTLGSFELMLESGGALMLKADQQEGPAKLKVNGEEQTWHFEGGRAAWAPDVDQVGKLLLFEDGKEDLSLVHVARLRDGGWRVRPIPLWLSVLPPLVAIALALIFREVLLSLFMGIWVGSFIAGGLRIDSIYHFLISIFKVVSDYILKALNDTGHISIIVFSLLVGGMVAVISRNGGMAGVVNRLSRYARSDVSSQFVTWFLGVAIFFDDYANTLIVGNTMRPVTDRFRVSREKLSYLVDSTAAPVAAIAFITTWIGAELGYIDDGIKLLSNFPAGLTPYGIFLESIKYAFYPIFTLIFMLMIIFMRREFGPMYAAEVRARSTGQVGAAVVAVGTEEATEDLNPIPGIAHKAYNAVIPVCLVVGMTIFGLVDTGLTAVYNELAEAGKSPANFGWGAIWSAMGSLWPSGDASFFIKLGKVIGSADSYVALLYASLSGAAAAIFLTLAGRIMGLGGTMNTLVMGIKTMIPALMILTLAWSLAATTDELHTANFLTYALRDSLNPYFLPPIIFVLAAMISFSTGSSWSTMAILYPIAIPITWAVCQGKGIDPVHTMELLYNVIAIVLGASVLGDHCSPISDTTILSSLASNCNHIDHVRTQLPYALTVGLISMSFGTLATLLGGGWLLSGLLLLVGTAVMWALIRLVGKPLHTQDFTNQPDL